MRSPTPPSTRTSAGWWHVYSAPLSAVDQQLPIDRWKPYLKFHTASDLAPSLSKEFVEARFAFYGRTLEGVKEMQPRWKRAVNNLDTTRGELLGKVYVEQYFKPEEKARSSRNAAARTIARAVVSRKPRSMGMASLLTIACRN